MSHKMWHNVGMKTPKPPTKSEGLRLTVDQWTMLRALIQHYGGPWVGKLVEKHYRKLVADGKWPRAI